MKYYYDIQNEIYLVMFKFRFKINNKSTHPPTYSPKKILNKKCSPILLSLLFC